MRDGLIEQGKAFANINGAGNAVLDERLSCAAEGHADVHGRGAGFAEMLHLMAAVAGADAAMRGGADDFASAFVVEDGESAITSQGVLVDKDAAELGFTACEEAADKIFLDVEVLIEELGEELLVVAVANAHHGELEESGHGRRQGKDLFALQFHVEQHAFGG